MGAKKSFYLVYLDFPGYTTKPFRAELTPSQVDGISAMLERYRGSGAIKGYQLSQPSKPEWVHALVLSAEALKAQLVDLIEMEGR